MQRFVVACLVVGLVVAGYLGFLFLVQRSLLFPVPPAHTLELQEGASVVELELSFGSVYPVFLEPFRESAAAAPLLIFAHGNGELAQDWAKIFDEPRRWGWAVLLAEYPGYGRSDGKPSEQTVTEAVLAAYDWARRNPRIDSNRIVAYGRSLGGGPAGRLAAMRPVAALVLESSFTSVRVFAARYFAPGFLVRDPFDVLAAIGSYRGPLLVIHGQWDEIVPIREGRALATAVPGAVLHELPCGHNDCPRPWPILRDFLAGQGLMPGPAQD